MAKTKATGTTIVGLTADNYKRLSAVHIEPDPAGTVVVAGANAQGKTSVLDSIMHALGGAAAVGGTTQPVNTASPDGKAQVVVDLGDIRVTRKWAVDRNGGTKTSLVVEDADGNRKRSPQAILDALLGKISFDPLAFTRQGNTEQVRTIAGFVPGFEYDEYVARRNAAYEERTLAGRAARNATAALEAMVPPPEGTPTEVVDAAELTARLTAISDTNSATTTARDRITGIDDRISRLEEQIADLRNERADLEEVAAQPLQDPTPVRAELLALSDTNAQVYAAAKYRDAVAAAAAATAEHEAREGAVAAIEDGMRAALDAADLPVADLGFSADGGGITYNGQPFGQASGAEQLRVSLGVAMALNPALRVVLVRDGSLLDEANLAMVDAMAKDRGYQVWLERVDSTGSTGIVIEDGTIAHNHYDDDDNAGDADGGGEG